MKRIEGKRQPHRLSLSDHRRPSAEQTNKLACPRESLHSGGRVSEWRVDQRDQAGSKRQAGSAVRGASTYDVLFRNSGTAHASVRHKSCVRRLLNRLARPDLTATAGIVTTDN